VFIFFITAIARGVYFTVVFIFVDRFIYTH